MRWLREHAEGISAALVFAGLLAALAATAVLVWWAIGTTNAQPGVQPGGSGIQGVAAALASTIPNVSFESGLRIADRIHNTGKAIVWSGHREAAELYWEQLRGFGLTMAPLER